MPILTAALPFPEEVKDVYDKFVSGEIDADHAKRRLVIMEPVLRARFDLRQR